MKWLERVFEAALWRSRFVVLFAVLASMLLGFAILYVTTTDVVLLLSHVINYAAPSLDAAARKEMHDTIVTHIVGVVDGYLLATFMLIFSLGLYELFISDIDEARSQKTSSKILVIESLDDLKQRLAKLIIMIMIVTIFEHAISLKIDRPLDLLYVALSITFIGIALYFTHKAEGSAGADDTQHD